MRADDVCKAIIAKNGAEFQYNVCIEELAELTKELTKAIRGRADHAHICEEIADVEICLRQLKLIVPDSHRQVHMFTEYKLKRLQLVYIDGNKK